MTEETRAEDHLVIQHKDGPITVIAVPAPGRYERMHRVAVGDWICHDCGVLVVDREAHDRHHQLVEPTDVPRLRVLRPGGPR